MNIREAVIALIFFTGAVLPVTAIYAQEDPKVLFYKANDFYENGEYDAAISEYEKILADGYESGAVYYNLGGAYFKAGKLGKAILSYERAGKLMPRDADLAANIRFARSKIKGGKVVPRRTIWDWTPLKMYSASFSTNELTVFASVTYVAVVLLLVLGVINYGIRKKILITSGILLILIVLNSAVIWKKSGGMGKDAVVIAPKTEALFGPFESETKFFTLYEGADCTVVKSKGVWYKIRRADGKTGWVKENKVEIV